MYDVYEYRVPRSHNVFWLTSACCVFFLGSALMMESSAAWIGFFVIAALMVASAFSRPPVPGIQIDHATLTLRAWHDPRPIPLADIDHLRMAYWTDETDMILVLRDGTEELIPAGELPDANTLSRILAWRDIAVKDPVAPPSRL